MYCIPLVDKQNYLLMKQCTYKHNYIPFLYPGKTNIDNFCFFLVENNCRDFFMGRSLNVQFISKQNMCNKNKATNLRTLKYLCSSERNVS